MGGASMKKIFAVSLAAAICVGGMTQSNAAGHADKKWAETTTNDGYNVVVNQKGPALGYSPKSGVKLLTVDGLAFKDLNRNGKLDTFEDWRCTPEERARDLAEQLSIDQISGLMLYSAHQFKISPELTDDQEKFLRVDGIRSVLNADDSAGTETTAKWNNAMQSYAEVQPFGIPINTSSDPRSAARADGIYVKGTTGGISRWPSNLGIAATFDDGIAKQFGKVYAKEYRMLGIGTGLSPQVDLATDPRWARDFGTFGEDPALSRDMTKATIEGLQSTYDKRGRDLGWGSQSLNAMMKHWPGDGVGESGREAHSQTGKYAVYPGENFQAQLIPFVDGGLNLASKTKKSSAIMSSYSIAWSDGALGEKVGSAFSYFKITQLLRDKYGYDGVICTDWGVTKTPAKSFSTAWGLEDGYTEAERHYKALMAGVDQFGGNNDKIPVLDAYKIGVKEHGDAFMQSRFKTSAVRLLRNMFQIGLFENPYVNVAEAVKTVGNPTDMAAGYQAQLKSIVMLKNVNGIIHQQKTTTQKPTVYIPMIYRPVIENKVFGKYAPASWRLPVNLEVAQQYFNVVTDMVHPTLSAEDKNGKPMATLADITRLSKEDIQKCDYVLAVIDNPTTEGNLFDGYGWNQQDGYIPVSLQYGKYTADSAAVREVSIAGNKGENRSYYGKTAKIINASDLDGVIYGSTAAKSATDKKIPVITVIRANNPMVFSEFENKVDAILMGFGISDQAYFDIIAGKAQPGGLLPMQMPLNMNEVEKQYEDVPRDMQCYVDSDGHTYNFAYGLNWNGVIKDSRTKKYNVPILTQP